MNKQWQLIHIKTKAIHYYVCHIPCHTYMMVKEDYATSYICTDCGAKIPVAVIKKAIKYNKLARIASTEASI